MANESKIYQLNCMLVIYDFTMACMPVGIKFTATYVGMVVE